MAKQVFKYEKQHKEDPRICKRCGKVIGINYLINGICDKCTKEIVRENAEKQNNRYWVVNEKEAKEMNIK